MANSKYALLRYRTIENCLQDNSRRWTLEDLMKACTDVLRHQENLAKGISKRTIQADIELMRSKTRGYGAPIQITERKYYTYGHQDFSILKGPLAEPDRKSLQGLKAELKQLLGHEELQALNGWTEFLDDKISKEEGQPYPAIEMEEAVSQGNLGLFQKLYVGIKRQQVLEVRLKNHAQTKPQRMVFHPYLLKEYKSNWYLIGRKDSVEAIQAIEINQIEKVEELHEVPYSNEPFFDADTAYRNVIGVDYNQSRPLNVHLWCNSGLAEKLMASPLHSSQQIVREEEDGVEFVLKVILNKDLEMAILSFGDEAVILAPKALRRKMHERIKKLAGLY